MVKNDQPESEHSRRLYNIITDLLERRREVAASSLDSLERGVKIKEIQDAMEAVYLAMEDEDQFAELEHKEAELSAARAASLTRVDRSPDEEGN